MILRSKLKSGPRQQAETREQRKDGREEQTFEQGRNEGIDRRMIKETRRKEGRKEVTNK